MKDDNQYYLRARALLIRVFCRISVMEHDLHSLRDHEHKKVNLNAPDTETLTDVKRELEKAYVRLHAVRSAIDVHPQGTVLEIMRLADKMGETF